MGSTLNINQFAQQAVIGQLDQTINDSGLIPCQVSTNQATALVPGQRVKLDTANTTLMMPQIVAAGVTDNAIGVIAYDVKIASPVAGNIVKVAYFGGPVMWLKASATIVVQVEVEDDGAGGVRTHSGNNPMGFALDPGVTGQLLRVILTNPTVD